MNPRNDFYISYSARKLYLTCPKAYHFRYILREKARSDPKTTMFGTIIGRVFEEFYTKRYWAEKDPLKCITSTIPGLIDETFDKEGYIRGTDASYEANLRDLLSKYVPTGLETIKKHRFLTPHSQAELDLTVRYQSDDMDYVIKLGGRADFIHGDDLTNVYILDGKASAYRDKYVDSEQLIWYATQYYLRNSVAPRRLGFVFWSFPEDPVTWVAYGSDDMRSCVSKTVTVVEKIKRGEFESKPSGECNRCSYKHLCSDGTRHLAALKVNKQGRIDTDLFDMEAV